MPPISQSDKQQINDLVDDFAHKKPSQVMKESGLDAPDFLVALGTFIAVHIAKPLAKAAIDTVGAAYMDSDQREAAKTGLDIAAIALDQDISPIDAATQYCEQEGIDPHALTEQMTKALENGDLGPGEAEMVGEIVEHLEGEVRGQMQGHTQAATQAHTTTAEMEQAEPGILDRLMENITQSVAEQEAEVDQGLDLDLAAAEVVDGLIGGEDELEEERQKETSLTEFERQLIEDQHQSTDTPSIEADPMDQLLTSDRNGLTTPTIVPPFDDTSSMHAEVSGWPPPDRSQVKEAREAHVESGGSDLKEVGNTELGNQSATAMMSEEHRKQLQEQNAKGG